MQNLGQSIIYVYYDFFLTFDFNVSTSSTSINPGYHETDAALLVALYLLAEFFVAAAHVAAPQVAHVAIGAADAVVVDDDTDVIG